MQQGVELEETPPTRLNRRLVSKRFLEYGPVSPHECTPETETTSLTEYTPVSEWEQACVEPGDDVVELHTGTEEL